MKVGEDVSDFTLGMRLIMQGFIQRGGSQEYPPPPVEKPINVHNASIVMRVISPVLLPYDHMKVSLPPTQEKNLYRCAFLYQVMGALPHKLLWLYYYIVD